MSTNYDGPLPGSYWVEVGRLLAGPYPGSPDPTQMQLRLAALRAVGITAFVNLTQSSEREAYSPLLPNGVQYWRFPIPDFAVPTDDQMMDILNTVDRLLAEDYTVYVHCWGGVGRTGTTVGCFWVRHGMSGPDALDEIARRLHGHSPDTDEQRQMILRWSQAEEVRKR